MKLVIAIAVFAAGIAASVTLTTAHADTVGLGDLGGLGYVLSLQFNVQTGCGMYVVISGNGAPETVIGDPSHPGCQPPGAIESRVAALLAAYPPVHATTSTESAQTLTVTTTETRTEFVTVTAPAVTETQTVATTVLAPTTVASVETVERLATVAQTVTNTVTVAPPAPVVSPMDAASSSALESVYEATSDEGAAALAARSAGLDVVYGLALA